MRTIDAIVIHCSATPEGRNVTAKDVDMWHRSRGFVCIGYHFFIRLDGTVEKGRDISMCGAHCTQKSMNRVSVGICYAGGYAKDGKTPKDTRTPAQRMALRSLVARLMKEYSIPENRVFGHRDFAPKACPCFDVHAEKWI